MDVDQPPVNPPITPSTPAGPEPAPPDPPEFHWRFACLAGVSTIGVLVVFLSFTDLVSDKFGLDTTIWNQLGGRGQLAVKITAILAILGAITVAIGVWMALVEWRGGFKAAKPTRRDAGEGVSKVVESVGKLRGAALVIVVGALLMLGAAWIVSSAAAPPLETSETTAGS